MTRHNDGDISGETHSNDKRANEESHPSKSIEIITARRCTEGEASSKQESRQDIQENKIEGSTSIFPTPTSVIPAMDNRSYTPRPLSTRGSVIMASVRPMLQEVGRGAFMPGLRPGFPPQQPHVFLSQDRKPQVPPTAATPLHEEPLQPLPSKMPQPIRSPAPVSFAVGSELEPLDIPVFRPRPRGIPTR